MLIFISWLVCSVKFTSWDFRNELWGPAYLLWHQESAYNITILFPDSNSIWFPQIIGLFFPLGLLSQYQAANLWLGMNIVLLIILIWFLTKQALKEKPKPLLFSILVLAVFIFPPTIRLLVLGQMDVIFITTTIAGTFALEKRKLVLSGFLYTIALSKPQLCIIVLPSLIGYLLLIKRDWRNTFKLLLMICFFTLALTIPLWVGKPNWVKDFLSNLSRNPQWLQPSMFSLFRTRIGPSGTVFWFMLFILILIISFWLWLKFGSTYAILWSMALTTIASPYIWSWDFILLLPLFIDTSARLTNKLARITLFGFFIFCLIFSVVSLQFTTHPDDSLLWWFPIVMCTGIVLSLKFNKRPEKVGDDAKHSGFL